MHRPARPNSVRSSKCGQFSRHTRSATLIATKAWDFSVLSTAAVRGMHRRMVRTDHSSLVTAVDAK